MHVRAWVGLPRRGPSREDALPSAGCYPEVLSIRRRLHTRRVTTDCRIPTSGDSHAVFPDMTGNCSNVCLIDVHTGGSLSEDDAAASGRGEMRGLRMASSGRSSHIQRVRAFSWEDAVIPQTTRPHDLRQGGCGLAGPS